MGFLSRIFGGTDHTEAVRTALAQGAPIVDVRTAQEFAGKHIKGAINIPHDQIPSQVSKLGPKNRPVIVYCRSGARSGQAARFLLSSGFKEVIDVGPIGRFPAGVV